MTKSFFPWISDDVINQTNHVLDNPNKSDVWFGDAQRAILGTAFGVPGMRKSGHRRYNHDLMSALMKGYQVAGTDGAIVAMNHLLQDTANDYLVRSMGLDMANLFESAFLVATGKTRKAPKRWY